MKKLVLTYGLIAGAIVSAWLFVGVAIGTENMIENGMFFGYTAMLIAFAFIFVAVKNFRNQNQGHVSFGKAFKIGLYVTLIASTMYVLAWLIDYYFFVPDFMEVYSTHVLDKMKADGASATEIAAKTAEMASFSEMYKNPLMVILFTYFEILPVGLIVSLITAVFLSKRQTVATS
ncbi:MAG TPA: DUF4199 domain-containing protein [Flavobacterium sp.]|jgi:hypothetical protein